MGGSKVKTELRDITFFTGNQPIYYRINSRRDRASPQSLSITAVEPAASISYRSQGATRLYSPLESFSLHRFIRFLHLRPQTSTGSSRFSFNAASSHQFRLR